MYVHRRKKPGFPMNSFPEQPIIAVSVFQGIPKMCDLLIQPMDGMQCFTRRRRATGRVLRP